MVQEKPSATILSAGIAALRFVGKNRDWKLKDYAEDLQMLRESEATVILSISKPRPKGEEGAEKGVRKLRAEVHQPRVKSRAMSICPGPM